MHQRRRPRALTLTLPNSQQPFLMFAEKKYTLRNFNDEGLGLWLPQPLPYNLHAGLHMSGDICIGNQIFPAKLEVRHVSPGIAGLQFTDISPELREIFRQMILPSTYAAGLKPQKEVNREDSKVGYPRLWFTGPGNAELVVWYNAFQKMVQAIQVAWLGRWIYRQQFQPVRTGSLVEDYRPQGRLVPPDQLLVVHEHPDPALLAEAAQFLTAVPMPLPGHLLWQFLEMGEQVYLADEIFTNIKVA